MAMPEKLSQRIKVLRGLDPDAYTAAAHVGEVMDVRGFTSGMVCSLIGTLGSTATDTTILQESAAPSQHVADLDLTQDTSLMLRDDTASNIELGIQFTPTSDITVTSVFLNLMVNGTIAAGKKVTMTIQADSSDEPDDSDLFTPIEVLCSTISDEAFTAVEFELTTPYHLTADATYWIVLEGDYTQSGTNNVALAIDTVASGGNVNFHDADWDTLVTTQKGHCAVLGYVWSNVTSASTGALASSDGVHLFDVNLDARKHYLRMKKTIATNASDAAAIFIAGGAIVEPVTQENTVITAV